MAELIVSILVLLVASRALGEVFERFRQSSMIGEILAGIILGPALLGFIAPNQGLEDIAIVASLGTFMIVLLAGLEMRFEDISGAIRGGGLVIGPVAFLVPFAMGYALAAYLELGIQATLVLSLAVAITALPVSVRILLDLGLTRHPVGRTIVSVAIIDDLTALTLLGIILALAATPGSTFDQGLEIGAVTILKTGLLVTFVLVISQALRHTKNVSPATSRRVRQAAQSLRGREALFAFSMLFVLGFASVAALLGLHFVVGTFFGGLLLSARLLNKYNYRQVERTTSAIAYGFLAPIFFGYIGLRLVPDALVTQPLLAGVILGVAVAGKLAGGYLGGRLARFSHRRAIALGVGLNARGMMEIVVASLAYSAGIIGADLFSILVLVAVVTTMMTPPLLRRAVDRSDRAEALVSKGTAGASSTTPPPSAGFASQSTGNLIASPIVIVGGGRVAIEIAGAVGKCTIIERDIAQAKATASALQEVVVSVGDANDDEALMKGGVGRDAIVLAVTNSDQTNEHVVRFARAGGARRIIARAESAEAADRLRSIGADAVISSSQQTAAAILLELFPPDATMEELLVPNGSAAVGHSIGELQVPPGVSVRSVTRRGRVHAPSPDLVLDARDSIILSGPPGGLVRARSMFLGNAGYGTRLNILTFYPGAVQRNELVARELAPLAALSSGAVVAAGPWPSATDLDALAAASAFEDSGIHAQLMPKVEVSGSEMYQALRLMQPGPNSTDASAPGHGMAVADGGRWLAAVPGESVGKATGNLQPRKVAGLPTACGAPVYFARCGRVPRTVTALIDGAEGADLAGTLAADIALLLGAHLQAIVVRFEDDPEPLEQAAYIEAYSRNIGLGTLDRIDLDAPTVSAIENALRTGHDLLVAPSMARAVRPTFLSQLASTGENSLLLV